MHFCISLHIIEFEICCVELSSDWYTRYGKCLAFQKLRKINFKFISRLNMYLTYIFINSFCFLKQNSKEFGSLICVGILGFVLSETHSEIDTLWSQSFPKLDKVGNCKQAKSIQVCREFEIGYSPLLLDCANRKLLSWKNRTPLRNWALDFSHHNCWLVQLQEQQT